MDDQPVTPQIRFKSFTDPWEQRKLGELSIVGSGRDYKHLRNGSIPVYGTGGYMLSVDKALSYSTDAIGLGRKGTIDKPYLLKAPFWTVDTLFYIIPIAANELKFLLALFQKNDWKSKDESTGVPSLSKSTIETTAVCAPKEIEQTKIGTFFQHLDNLITLHQRKCDKLGVIKKSMLEKMFPKSGADVPEIRFQGFTDPWEQRKLGDIAEETYGGGTPRTSIKDYWNGDIPWFQSSDLADGKIFGAINNKRISQEGLKFSAAKLVPANSIAIITRVGVGKLVFLQYPYTTSQDFLSLSKLNSNPWFTVYAVYKKLQSELNAVQGTSIKGITKEELLFKKITLPSIEEQALIGTFFQHLDNLITLHQRELDVLKNIKQSCLQKMFV